MITTRPSNDYASDIASTWGKALICVMETGRLLVQAKANLPHGDYQAMIERELPFSPSTARKLVAVAEHPKLADRSIWNDLPSAWTVLYSLSNLQPETIDKGLFQGLIKPDMTPGDIAELKAIEKPKAPKDSKIIDVQGEEVGPDDDKPVFDASDAGEAMAAEKREAFAEQDLNDANQVLLDALSAVERATAYKNLAHINRDSVNQKRVLSSIIALEQLLPSAQRFHSAGPSRS